MGCACALPCACAPRSISRARRSSRFASRRAIGSAVSVGSQVAQTFDLQQYVPAEIQTDYATGKSYYDAFAQASQGVTVGPHGTVAISDGAKQAVLQATAATVAAAIPVAGPVIAGLLELYNIAPHAGSGPGVCGTDPPAGPAPSQLAAWSNFKPWGASPAYPAGSFEAFANPVLTYNEDLANNCFVSMYVPPPVLLASLIASWNATHAGPARTITRSGLNSASWTIPAGYDAIAHALEVAIQLGAHCPTDSAGFVTSATCGPENVTSSFQVNSGPIIIKPLTLHFPSPAVAAKAPSPASPAGSSTSAAAVATVAVLALGGAAAFFVARTPKLRARFRRMTR